MNSNNISHRRGAKFCLALFFLLGCGLFSGSNAIAQTRDWQPQRTWVFVVGTLQWKHRDMFDSFPQKDRRDAQLVLPDTGHRVVERSPQHAITSW